jgi:uncharacterized protein YggU (UPF0235/DUF167 family)
VRVTIRVRPGSGRTVVGGSHDGALVVRVGERAVDGRATEAALTALASALGLRRREVELVTGATSRTKVVEIPDASAAAVGTLLQA